MKANLAFLAVALILTLSGCSKSDDATISGAAPSTPATASSDQANIQVQFESIVEHVPGEANELKGTGATFPQQLYKAWFNAYKNSIAVEAKYEGTGSGAGIKAIINREVDFAGSDAPMTDEQLAAAKGGAVLHIPTALGAIVPTYNIPSMSRKLKFSGENIAQIYLGEITQWNDAALIADNPQLAAINQKIVVVHRSDGSGSTYGFTDYLSAISPAFKTRVGKGTSVTWPVGIGAEGNAGVAQEIRANPYSFGYVELSYAIGDKLAFGMVRNKVGRFIDPTLAAVTAAAANAEVAADLRFSLVNAAGDNSYPICTATWLIAYRDQTDYSRGLALGRLLWWATHEAQGVSTTLNYAPVPREITLRSELLLKQLNVEGKPIFAQK